MEENIKQEALSPHAPREQPSQVNQGARTPTVEVELYHKERGGKGVWKLIDQGTHIRVTKNVGKRVKLVAKGSLKYTRSDLQLKLVDLSESLNPQEGQFQLETVVLKENDWSGDTAECELKVFTLSKRLVFQVEVNRSDDDPVVGSSIWFGSHNSGKQREKRRESSQTTKSQPSSSQRKKKESTSEISFISAEIKRPRENTERSYSPDSKRKRIFHTFSAYPSYRHIPYPDLLNAFDIITQRRDLSIPFNHGDDTWRFLAAETHNRFPEVMSSDQQIQYICMMPIVICAIIQHSSVNPSDPILRSIADLNWTFPFGSITQEVERLKGDASMICHGMTITNPGVPSHHSHSPNTQFRGGSPPGAYTGHPSNTPFKQEHNYPAQPPYGQPYNSSYSGTVANHPAPPNPPYISPKRGYEYNNEYKTEYNNNEYTLPPNVPAAPPISTRTAVTNSIDFFAHPNVDQQATQAFNSYCFTHVIPEARVRGSHIAVGLQSNALMNPPELTLVVYKTDTLLSDTTTILAPNARCLFLTEPDDVGVYTVVAFFKGPVLQFPDEGCLALYDLRGQIPYLQLAALSPANISSGNNLWVVGNFVISDNDAYFSHKAAQKDVQLISSPHFSDDEDDEANYSPPSIASIIPQPQHQYPQHYQPLDSQNPLPPLSTPQYHPNQPNPYDAYSTTRSQSSVGSAGGEYADGVPGFVDICANGTGNGAGVGVGVGVGNGAGTGNVNPAHAPVQRADELDTRYAEGDSRRYPNFGSQLY
eukprot:TRINITY_DN615_c0_g1_i1.p1 TRINITY_DN615_c0_g1~~TRINITY_DN615_c0_g1_i1.p1  ORF type:complete len:760 (+),score=127.28 TRINITY_DN615_c0_g1_i1:51-2330(+)